METAILLGLSLAQSAKRQLLATATIGVLAGQVVLMSWLILLAFAECIMLSFMFLARELFG